MKSLIFLVLATLLTLTGAYARKPAVEDFVGVESEHPDVTPEGTEALFNFESDVKQYQGRPAQAPQAVVNQRHSTTPTQQTSWPLSAWFGALVVLVLPFITWMLTMRHLKSRQTQAASELPSNVTQLPSRARTEEKDDIKKAS